jgi:tetratricopeptide (TPR) repeat protein
MDQLFELTSNLRLTNEKVFVEYSQEDEDKWAQLKDWPIVHTILGNCFLVKTQSINGNFTLFFSFENNPTGKERKFTKGSFEEGLFVLSSLPPQLEVVISQTRVELEERMRLQEIRRQEIRKENERREKEFEENQKRQEAERLTRLEQERFQNEREADARIHFTDLKTKYGLESLTATSPTSEIYKVLVQMDGGDRVDPKDIEWLAYHRMNNVLAIYYSLQYEASHDGWDLITAGKYWRKAKQPQRALDISASIQFQDPKIQAAVLTNRGGAHRDLKNLEDAEKCASEAIHLQPNRYYPYNLLGAIYYQRGDPGQGDQQFRRAIELGSKPREQDEMIQNAVIDSDENIKRTVAEYLIAKDPQRYQWAEKYLE